MTILTGFINLGNTCYLNSGLQMLIQNKEFCRLIIKNKNNNSILLKLSEFISEYYDPNTQHISPIYIKNIVGEKNNIFNGYKQNDAGEFIIYFLDVINEELKKNNCDLSDLFELQTKISIKCKLKKCLNISSHVEKNLFLFLNISQNNLTLNDCYLDYKARIKLENDELYYCEKCQAKRIASKKTEIIKFPKHLIVYLKRFEQKGTRLFKNNKELDVPLVWKNYNLQGIVYHSGSLFGGHYIYIGNHNDKWLMFNDDSVTEIHERTLNQYKNYGYILYYSM
jgi:ubiquitin C-terminal hydrolase